MNDSNWKKMVQIIFRLCKKYKKAVESTRDSQADFSSLSESADPAMVARWAEEEAKAQRDRDQHEGAMDIFDIRLSKGSLSSILSSFQLNIS